MIARCRHPSAGALLTRLVKPSHLPSTSSHQQFRLPVYKPAVYHQPITPRHFTTTTPNMSSATTFYDFKPLDSKPNRPSLLFTHHHLPILTHPLPSQQRRAPNSPSPPTKAKSSSSSTSPPNAASPRNTPASKRSTRKSRRSTPTTLRSWAFHATSSAGRNRVPRKKSSRSASSTMAFRSPS